MNYFSTDHLIVYTSLLLTLIVGLRAGRGIKTIREYAVGNKMFGTASLVFTYLATNLAGASIINVASIIFSDGIIISVALLGLIISSIVLAFFIVPHAIYFPTCITMGDIMEQLYGKVSGVIAGTLGLLSSIFLAGMELIVLGIICESLLGIDAKVAILVGGFMLTLYSAHGGIKSVVTTDVLQFLMVVVGIPIIAYIAVSQVGGINGLLSQVPQEKWVIIDHPKFYFYVNLFLLFTVFPAGMIDSAIIQRLLMGKTKQQLRNQYLAVAFVDQLFQFMVLLIALAGVVLYPGGEPTEIVPRMINDFFPIGLKGLVVTGLLAIVMSTVDSHLHVTGLMLVHDIIKPICGKSGKVLSETREKRFAQWATIVVGMAAIAIALHTTDMFGLLMDSLEATGPLLMFPLLSGMMGLKPEKKAFYTAAVVTVGTWVACRLLLPEAYDYLTTLLCIVVNGISFFGTHFYINKGFKKVERKKELSLNAFTPSSPFFQDLLPKNLLVYVQQQLKGYNPPYVLAGIFCLFNLIAPHFLLNQLIKVHPKCLLVAHVVGGILSVLLMAKEKWSSFFQVKYLPALFYWTLLYCLPFTSMLMFILSGGDSNWLAHLLISLTFLLVLVDWGMALLLTALGIGFSLLLYPYIGPIAWEWHTTSGNLRMCQLLFALLVGIFFARRKQKQIHQLEQTQQQLRQRHTLLATDYLHSLQCQALGKKQLEIQKEPLRFAKAALHGLAKSHAADAPLAQKGLEQLDSFVAYCKASFYQTMDTLRLYISTIPLTDLLAQLNSQINDPAHAGRIRIQLLTQQKTITCDVKKIVQLLASQVKSMFQEAPNGFTLSIQDTQLSYQLQAVPGSTRQLPALGFLLTQAADVDLIQPCYQGTTLPTSLEVPENALELPARNQTQLIEAHYGYQESTPLGGRLYVLPLEVKQIRAAVVDQGPMSREVPLDTPVSIALERALLQRLLETSCLLDLTIVREAIDMIKQLHQGQFRKSGEPFYTHPVEVATILLTMTQDPDAILAALLHDVVEDTPVHLEQLAYQYGQKVAYLVQQVTNVDPTGKKTKLTEGESHEQLAASSDKYALMIKLADRLHNMRTLGVHKLDKQRHIAQETLDFYLLLADGLEGEGVKQVVSELRAICEVILAKG
ncbi:MAG: HD domain-containing protein [Amoebophilaceae bacterium]|nr:HD domain-containing protein [Amoebophilaceae bacterium]